MKNKITETAESAKMCIDIAQRELNTYKNEKKSDFLFVEAQIELAINFLQKSLFYLRNEIDGKPKMVEKLFVSIKELFVEADVIELQLTLRDLKELFFKKEEEVDVVQLRSVMNTFFPNVKKHKNGLGREATKHYLFPKKLLGIDNKHTFIFEHRNGRPYIFLKHEFENDL